MLRKLLPIQEHRINHDTHFIHSGEKRIYVVVATEECEIFEFLFVFEFLFMFDFLFVHTLIDNQLRPDNIQTQPQLDQYTEHLAPVDLIFVCEEVFLRVLRCVTIWDEVVFNYEVDDTAVLSHPNLLMITHAKFSVLLGLIGLMIILVKVEKVNVLFSMNHPENGCT